jgi:hypothetical protein
MEAKHHGRIKMDHQMRSTEVKLMVKVRTFTTELKIFQTINELTELDEKVNQFIADHGIEEVISVSDCATTNNSGMTMGLIQTLTYRE